MIAWIKKTGWLNFIPLALLGAAGFYFWHTYPHFVVDDAFITARYARNLAVFGELTWNPGLDPVEGYTGILLPLLLAAVMAVFPGLDFALMPAVYGMAAFLGAGWLLWRAWNEQQLPWLPQAGLMAVFASAPSIHPHIFAGLETLIFIFFCGSVNQPSRAGTAPAAHRSFARADGQPAAERFDPP